MERKGFMYFVLAHFIPGKDDISDLRKFNFQASHLPFECNLLENYRKWPTQNTNIAYAKQRQLTNDIKKTNAVNVESIGKYDALEMKQGRSLKESEKNKHIHRNKLVPTD